MILVSRDQTVTMRILSIILLPISVLWYSRFWLYNFLLDERTSTKIYCLDKLDIHGFKVTVIYNLAKTGNTEYNIYYSLFCEKCKKSDSLDEGGKTGKNAFLDV